jgi:hypothetical protein
VPLLVLPPELLELLLLLDELLVLPPELLELLLLLLLLLEELLVLPPLLLPLELLELPPWWWCSWYSPATAEFAPASAVKHVTAINARALLEN